MSLQELIPPIDIPVLLHLPIVYFAIAFLVVVILLEMVNLVFHKRALSVFSLFIIVLFASTIGLAYLSTGTDGKEIVMEVTKAGESALTDYKTFGVYLGYGALALIFIKMLFMAMSNAITRVFFVFLLFCVLVLSGIQVKNGTLLRQEFGMQSNYLDIQKEKIQLQNRYNELESKYKELLVKVEENNQIAQELKSLQTKYETLVQQNSKEEKKEKIADNPKSEDADIATKEQEQTTQTPFDSQTTKEVTTTEPREDHIIVSPIKTKETHLSKH